MMEDVIDFDINIHTVTPAPIDGEIADTFKLSLTQNITMQLNYNLGQIE